jgi:hypothetical protein
MNEGEAIQSDWRRQPNHGLERFSSGAYPTGRSSQSTIECLALQRDSQRGDAHLYIPGSWSIGRDGWQCRLHWRHCTAGTFTRGRMGCGTGAIRRSNWYRQPGAEQFGWDTRFEARMSDLCDVDSVRTLCKSHPSSLWVCYILGALYFLKNLRGFGETV